MQVAGAIARELGVLIGDMQIFHAVEMRWRRRSSSTRLRIASMCEPCTHSFSTKAPFDTMTPGFGELSGCCGERRPMNRAGAGMREKPGKVRRRRDELDHHGRFVRRRYAQRFRRLLAGDDVGGVGDHIDDLRVLRGRRRSRPADAAPPRSPAATTRSPFDQRAAGAE